MPANCNDWIMAKKTQQKTNKTKQKKNNNKDKNGEIIKDWIAKKKLW